MAQKHIILGGSTGFIGSSLRKLLQHHQVKVTGVSRKPQPNHITWEDIKSNGLPKDATDVINVAGANILDLTQRWNDAFKKEVWTSRVDTNKTLAAAIKESNVNFFCTISGVAYYKPGLEKEYTELDHCNQYDFLSELTHAWEKAAEVPESNCRQATIRSGVVLGRTGGMIKQIFLPFYIGVGGTLGGGDQYMPWIHVADLVNLFWFAVSNPEVKGVLNGVAPEVITNEKFTKAFCSALNRPTIFPMPEFAVKIFFGKERAKIVLDGQKVVPKRVQEYGFKYQFPDIDSACQEFAHLFYKEPPY